MNDLTLINNLLKLDEEKLYKILVDELQEFSGEFFSPGSKEALGRKWFKEKKDFLNEKNL